MMKMILSCLSFYLVFNFISAFNTSNAQLHEQANNASNISHSASHGQELVYQQQIHSHNAIIAHDHADTINTKKNRVHQQNRPRPQRGQYQAQERLQATTQDNSMINDRLIHPKFRPWLRTSPNIETQFSLLKTTTAISNLNISSIQLNQSHLVDGRVLVNTTKSASLLHILTPKSQTQGHISMADSFFQQQLRALFDHQHDKHPSPTRSNIKTGLR